jgi:hypothetical protein
MHQLGNLALLNQSVNAKITNGPFVKKQDHLKLSPYPLTRQIGESERWDLKAVQGCHDKIMGLASLVWNLEYKPSKV